MGPGFGWLVFFILIFVLGMGAYFLYDLNGKKNAKTPEELAAHNRKMEKIDKATLVAGVVMSAAGEALDRSNQKRAAQQKQAEINQYNEQVRQYNQQVMRNHRGY